MDKRIFVTRSLIDSCTEELRKQIKHVEIWNSEDIPPTPDELKDKVKGCDGILCLLTDKIDKAVIEAAGPSLKIVSTMSVGYDHVDVEECKAKNVMVTNTPGVLTDATADLTLTLLLTVARRVPEAVAAVKDGSWGTWRPTWMCGTQMSGKVVGIVGMGRIGTAVAERLIPFGVEQVLYTARGARDLPDHLKATHVQLDELLEKSDIVIATCALTKETKGMFNKKAFQAMKNSALFINTARGGIVVQEDLYDALKAHEIKAAGLDVTTPEPLPSESILLALPNCVIFPHIGSATDETRAAMAHLAVENLVAALGGSPVLHCV